MEYVIFIIIAYLLGSIPSALIVGKIGYNIDVREHGSKNMGATNAFRVLGKKAGIIVTISDILKGTLATIAPLIGAMFMDVEVSRLLIGIFAVIGHTYPIFAKFKGGKAVATSAGVALALHPIFLFIFVGVFLAILFTTSTVSIASILAVFFAAIGSFFLNDPFFSVIIWIIVFLILYLHRENIQRLRKGTESKVPFGLRSSKKDK